MKRIESGVLSLVDINSCQISKEQSQLLQEIDRAQQTCIALSKFHLSLSTLEQDDTLIEISAALSYIQLGQLVDILTIGGDNAEKDYSTFEIF
ncbi:hypothetical protein [Cognatishimia sp. F0-27]|uniref:hypothetical protein n=1 Tax=Cognatishimia sp. F0-27 TaxID=2816855 RepID=UPI001D0C528D|nr:hypothetical protein [Cognatishimia sp. F0-27]MCC1492053.1 hypothetical protein [Cognatishimia sp. F0-27]